MHTSDKRGLAEWTQERKKRSSALIFIALRYFAYMLRKRLYYTLDCFVSSFEKKKNRSVDSIAEKVFTSLQLYLTPPQASSYLDFIIVQRYRKSSSLFTLSEYLETFNFGSAFKANLDQFADFFNCLYVLFNPFI